MAHAFHLYRPQRTCPELLEKTFVARESLLDDILARLKRWKPGDSRQHYLFIGPRGIGKTNILRLVEHRVKTRPGLSEKWISVVLPEDFYGIGNVSDLLLEALRRLAQESGMRELESVHGSIRFDADDGRVNDRCLDAFRQFHGDSGRGIILMVENLDRLFERQLKKKPELHSLRKILIEEDWLVMLCASPTYLNAVTDPGEPFFEFFKVQLLSELTPEQQRELLLKLAAVEKNKAFEEYLERFQPRLRALYHFTGGNPRLTIMLYDLLAHQRVNAIRNQLDLLLDQLTPYYQDRMKDVSEQEARILEAMALLPEGCSPTDLAEEVRMPAKLVRAILTRLERSGYVRREQRREKRTVYIVPERFFRIWHQMNHSRTLRGRVQYLLEFFSDWYSTREERDYVWDRLKDELARSSEKENGWRVDDVAECMDYIVATSEGQEKLERIYERLRRVPTAKGWEYIGDELDSLSEDSLEGGTAPQGEERSEDEPQDFEDEARFHEEASEAFRQYLEYNNSDLAAQYNYAVALGKTGRTEAALRAYDRAAILLASEEELGIKDYPAGTLVEVLRSSFNRRNVWLAAQLLGRRSAAEEVTAIGKILQTSDLAWRRRHCATALGLIGDAGSMDLLLEHLSDPDAEVRGSAATALGRIGSAASVEPLVGALSDPAADVRGSAATALGRIGTAASVEPLVGALSDPAADVRGSAATALGWIGSAASVEPLVGALSDPAAKVRGSAATALGRIGSAASVEALVGALSDPDPINRGSAATALGRIGSAASVEPLVGALSDPAADVRGSAATALGRIVSDVTVSNLPPMAKAIAAGIPPQSFTEIRVFLRSVFRSGDLDLVRTIIGLLAIDLEEPEEFWLPYEIAVEYLLADRNPAILERQQPEMREAVQLLVGAFAEAGSALGSDTPPPPANPGGLRPDL